MLPRPELTVAIATRGRPDLLASVLTSLQRQRLRPDLFEVLVVLDGACDDSAAVVERLARTGDGVVRLVTPWSESRGLAAARNACVDEAAGRFVRLQDDDDVLDPFAVPAMLDAHHRHGPSVAVLGWTGISGDLLELPLMHYLAHVGGELFDYRTADPSTTLDFGWFWGGRSSVATELARTVRFDEVLRFGAEDIDFAYRAQQSFGMRVAYAPRVKGWQVRPVDLHGFTLRCGRQGEAARHVMGKDPNGPLGRWAVDAHTYDRWTDGDVEQLAVAFRRCRRLERLVEHELASWGTTGLRRQVHDAYWEVFKLARAITFSGRSLPTLTG